MKIVVQNQRPIDETRIAKWVAQIAAGLAYLHNADVAHGNIKTANIFVRSDGIVQLADFAKIQQSLDKSLIDDQQRMHWSSPELL